jgi:hypothetical protein
MRGICLLNDGPGEFCTFPRKTASAIKTFYLVELFGTTADGIVEWEKRRAKKLCFLRLPGNSRDKIHRLSPKRYSHRRRRL